MFYIKYLTLHEVHMHAGAIRQLLYGCAYIRDIPMFYIKYLTLHEVHMHAGAIRQLLYGCAYIREDNPLAKARGLSSRIYAQTIQ